MSVRTDHAVAVVSTSSSAWVSARTDHAVVDVSIASSARVSATTVADVSTSASACVSARTGHAAAPPGEAVPAPAPPPASAELPDSIPAISTDPEYRDTADKLLGFAIRFRDERLVHMLRSRVGQSDRKRAADQTDAGQTLAKKAAADRAALVETRRQAAEEDRR